MFKFSDPLISNEAFAYAKFLYSNVTDAVYLKFLDVTINGSKPKPKECHNNVNKFIEQNISFSPVYGWLVIDAPTTSQCLFLAHSVIKDTDGKLFEITPIQSCEPRPFIEAQLTDYDFEQLFYALLETSGNTTLVHTK